MMVETLLMIMLVISALTIGVLILVLARTIVYFIPMLNGPVFVRSKPKDIAAMIKLAKLKGDELIADLGSGDGEIVIALAERGYKVHGYEINPLLVKKSRQRIQELGLEKLATIYKQSFWKPDYGDYDVLMLYGTSYIMPKLEKKLQSELKKGSRIISNFFTFENWKPAATAADIRRYEK